MATVTWAWHAANFGASLLLVSMADRFVIEPMIVARISLPDKEMRTSRWFFVHAFANLLIVITAFPSLVAVLADPLHAMDSTVHSDSGLFGTGSVWPLTIVNAVHVYHVIGGFRLTPSEQFHHFLFIPTIGFPGQVLSWGALGNFQVMFMSGFPGMVDYFLLGLTKIKRCDALTEKRINSNLNVWCRAPGVGMSNFMLYQAMLYGHFQVPLWAAVLQLVLPPYNALYYGKQAVANYAVHYMLELLGQDELLKKRIEERTSVTTGTQIMSWKDALAVPQRGS